jgi:hypothetical protein
LSLSDRLNSDVVAQVAYPSSLADETLKAPRLVAQSDAPPQNPARPAPDLRRQSEKTSQLPTRQIHSIALNHRSARTILSAVPSLSSPTSAAGPAFHIEWETRTKDQVTRTLAGSRAQCECSAIRPGSSNLRRRTACSWTASRLTWVLHGRSAAGEPGRHAAASSGTRGRRLPAQTASDDLARHPAARQGSGSWSVGRWGRSPQCVGPSQVHRRRCPRPLDDRTAREPRRVWVGHHTRTPAVTATVRSAGPHWAGADDDPI